MISKETKIGVVFGGPSGEYEVSCVSANTIIQTLIENGYQNVFPIGVAKDGKWYGPVALNDVKSFDATDYANHELIMPQRPGAMLYDAVSFEPVLSIDVVFPIIHGSYGEDGHIQAFLEMCRIPFVGAGMSGSLVGMDKVLMRDILKAHDIPQTAYVPVRRFDFESHKTAVIEEIEAKLSYPMFVKPACSGSSVGISKVHNQEELEKALALAGKYDSKLLIEKGVNAREIETAVLGNYDVAIAASGEIITEGVFYDYDSKYVLDNSVIQVPADLSEETVQELNRIAKEVYKILDLRGMCRADFFIDKDNGNILVNEVNTLPGFTDISMYAKMWKTSGKSLIEVIERLIELAYAHHDDVLRNYTVFGG